jgi:hypothetical protein
MPRRCIACLEGPDGEGPGEVSVHRAGVGVGKGGKAEHFLKVLRRRHSWR